ncbi:uncharacterized protein LOC128259792 [Drosophila gunungcola]|uniref:Regulatory protein zeste n=1 Tax=Drosophila gunungcola TaxID=103775 RepID=A0A9P9YJW8_9MUSC|nr:uncharacterized protein LOC128259792 [Drosophila gunungcola]KAI8037889.1 hypothetical protein M5D96_009390 [Drosophila gunungcola]
MKRHRNQFKRGQNFSTDEEFLLITLAAEQRKIFENKRCDSVTWKAKELAWENLAATYSIKSGIKRSGHSLRAKYESLKKKLSGGLPQWQPPTISVSEKLKAILGDDDTGGENSDSDCVMTETPSEGPSGSYVDLIDFIEENSDENVASKTRNSTLVAPPRSPSARTGPKRCEMSSLLEEEKLRLIRAQRTFYEQENIRAQEKHLEEMATLSAKRELLCLEIAEKKQKLSDAPKD